MIRNKITGRVYVGQSVNVENRWRQHKRSLKRGDTTLLCQSMRKHGIEAFELILLEECGWANFDEREEYWMSHYKARGEGYNLMPPGQRGRVSDDAMRETIASKLRGKKLRPEVVEKIRAANTGRTHSAETKIKISEANKGRPKSPQASQKTAQKLRENWASLTEEQKSEYAKARSGWSQPDHVREATSKRFLGKPKSAETKERMRLARKNADPEKEKVRRQNLVEANLRRWAAYREAKEKPE